MKNQLRISFLLLGFLLFASNQGFSVVNFKVKTGEASGFMLADQKISVDDIANLKRKDIEEKIGKKLKFKERIVLGLAKKKVNKDLKKGKTMEEIEAELAASSGFNLGGFLLGIFLSLVGVLIAYLIFGRKNSGRTWAWIGAAISILILGAALII